MVNVLIADDNIDFATNLMNYINEKNDKVRVCYIAKDGKETLEFLNNNKTDIDVVLLDLDMPIFNGTQVLENIENEKKYEESFIIISGKDNLIKKISSKDLIYSVMHKAIEMNDIIEKINKLIEYKEKIKSKKRIEEKIIKELLYLGYDISYRGTKYLISSIEYCVLNQNCHTENLEKNVYPEVARRYNTSIHNVKSNINRTNNSMYYTCNVEKLKKYFTFDIDTKPKIKTVINTIINNISI